jgi:hypothetical protein
MSWFTSLFLSTWKIIVIKTFCVLSSFTYWIVRSMILLSYEECVCDVLFSGTCMLANTMSLHHLCRNRVLSILFLTKERRKCSAIRAYFFQKKKYVFQEESPYLLMVVQLQPIEIRTHHLL